VVPFDRFAVVLEERRNATPLHLILDDSSRLNCCGAVAVGKFAAGEIKVPEMDGASRKTKPSHVSR
jgi:hypothetical protein